MELDRFDVEQLRRKRGEKWHTYPEDVLAAWVADMDFPVAEPIARIARELVEVCDFGYPINPRPGDLPAVFARRMQQRYGWTLDPERVEVLSDVVQGMYIAVETLSEPGDAIVVPVPIYPPFLELVHDTGRAPVWQRYERGPDGFRPDLERMRAELHPRTRILMLCNPHNPTGHVLDAAELQALAQLVLERDLLVVSNEIHCDLVYEGARHVPFATLSPEIAERTVTLTSATKGFNIAGTRCAIAAFGSAQLQRRFNSIHPHLRGGLTSFGLQCSAVAWSDPLCQQWQDEVLRYLQGNRDHVADHVRRRWPQIAHVPPQATYLAWLDCRALSLQPTPQRFFLERGRVALGEGARFGEPGRGFARINFATSRAILQQVLERMDKALEGAARAG